ncbi:MAG: hypothetical protein ACI8P9_000118 [Parasphingorhabdus sp.]|jgi:hypothetical protein
MTKLTTDQIENYRQKGYVVPDYQLSDPVLENLRAEYAALLLRNPEIRSDIMLGPHLEKPGAQGVKGSRGFLEIASHPDLLDMAAQLIGDDIILWGTTIFGKPAKDGKQTPWHQDGDYYPIEPLETLSIWIALDDVTLDNGPMTMIPGSHKSRQIFSHHWEEDSQLVINQVCDSEHFNAQTAEPLILKAGQISLHDVYMIHGSMANTTPHRRAAFIVRLMPASCIYNHKKGQGMATPHMAHDYGQRPLYLVRGRDISESNNFTIGH